MGRYRGAFRKHEQGGWQLVLISVPDAPENSEACPASQITKANADSTNRPPVPRIEVTGGASAANQQAPISEKHAAPKMVSSGPAFDHVPWENDDLRTEPAPAIAEPPGIISRDRTWKSAITADGVRMGCGSHQGPPWTREDKANEDFAFAVERRDRAGNPWAIVGVCDGVGSSAWGDRGAQHAATAFLGVVGDALESDADLAETMQSAEKRREFAARFNQSAQLLLTNDVELLVSKRYVPTDWRPDLYAQRFLEGPDAASNRKEWLQTTLLAVALGPRGGFALLLGDGFVRIDRSRSDHEMRRKVVHIQTSEDQPERRVSLLTTTDEVDSGLRGILPERSAELGVVIATDGVSKTPKHGLEDRLFRDAEDCAGYLESLAGRPMGDVESDNMSVAFAVRRVE